MLRENAKNQLKHLISYKNSHILLLMKEDILQHRKSELTWYLCPLDEFVPQLATMAYADVFEFNLPTINIKLMED